MSKAKRLWLIIAAIPVLGLTLFFATARYGLEPYHGIRYISRSPVATITWGPASSYIVQRGINRVSDQGMGMAGNFLEFPVSSHTRVSMRLFSLRWLKEDFQAWRSDHEWARPRCERTSGYIGTTRSEPSETAPTAAIAAPPHLASLGC